MLNSSSYFDIQPHHVELFHDLWEKHYSKLPEIVTKVQDEENVKAAVFNFWLNYIHFDEYIVLKTEKQMLHAVEEYLINKLNLYMWKLDGLKVLFNEYHRSKDFIFIFSYLVTAEIFKELEIFKSQHSILHPIDLERFAYYRLSDDDFSPDSEVFYYIKIINAEFLNNYLTEPKIKNISLHLYRSLLQFKTAFVNMPTK